MESSSLPSLFGLLLPHSETKEPQPRSNRLSLDQIHFPTGVVAEVGLVVRAHHGSALICPLLDFYIPPKLYYIGEFALKSIYGYS